VAFGSSLAQSPGSVFRPLRSHPASYGQAWIEIQTADSADFNSTEEEQRLQMPSVSLEHLFKVYQEKEARSKEHYNQVERQVDIGHRRIEAASERMERKS